MSGGVSNHPNAEMQMTTSPSWLSSSFTWASTAISASTSSPLSLGLDYRIDLNVDREGLNWCEGDNVSSPGDPLSLKGFIYFFEKCWV